MSVRRVTSRALLAASPLLFATLLPPGGATFAAPSAAPVSPAVGHPPAVARARAGGWTRVSTGAVDSLSEITATRTADGVLHAVYQQDVGTNAEYEHVSLSTKAKVLGHSKPLGTWGTLVHNPKLLKSPPGGLRLVFSGLQDTNSANFFSHGYAYDTVSDAAGATWALQQHALTKFGSAYSGYGIGATTLSSGVPVTAASLNSDTYVRVGDVPTVDQTEVANAPDDAHYPEVLGDYVWATQLVNSGDTVWMVWYVDGRTPATDGIYARQVHPSAGPVMKAPSSSVSGGSLNPDQAVAAVARPGGGVVVAYKIGYPTANAIGVWQVGSSSVKRIKTKDVDQVALDVGPSGRMWLAWVDGSDTVRAVRSASTGLGFGAAQDLGKPSSGADLWRVAVDASLSQGTVLVNDVVSSSVSVRMVKPGLTLKVKPGSLRAGRAAWLKATVTDAGERVSGAKVRISGSKCTTNKAGKCTLEVTVKKAGKTRVTASKSGYGSARHTVKVKK